MMTRESTVNRISAKGSNWWEKLFNRPLVDLGENGEERLRGIYSPIYDKKEVRRFMSSYYETDEGAQSQVTKFDLTDYYLNLLNEALDRISFSRERGARPTILELGCGFGSATFPLLELLPKAYLIASEFSISMLLALKAKLEQRNMAGSCVLLQLNAEDLDFKAGSFDLIVGSALLHHLFQPEKVVEKSARILRRGGAAIFFEPFEIGHSVLSLIYKRILRDKRKIFLSQGTKKYLKSCIATWAKMSIKDKTDPFFVGIDDKWVFTKRYFFDSVEKYDYEKAIIFPLEKSNKPFLSLAKSHFKGNNIKNIPKWVWEIIDEYEEHFSEDVKTDLLTEGCIILKK